MFSVYMACICSIPLRIHCSARETEAKHREATHSHSLEQMCTPRVSPGKQPPLASRAQFAFRFPSNWLGVNFNGRLFERDAEGNRRPFWPPYFETPISRGIHVHLVRDSPSHRVERRQAKTLPAFAGEGRQQVLKSLGSPIEPATEKSVMAIGQSQTTRPRVLVIGSVSQVAVWGTSV